MKVISGHLGWVRALAVDPSNNVNIFIKWFVSGSNDRTIKFWDMASGDLKITLTGHINTIRGLCISKFLYLI
jgi:pleiotropic regulator 1